MPSPLPQTLDAALQLIQQLRDQLQQVLEVNSQLQAQVLSLSQENQVLLQEILDLRAGRGGGGGTASKPAFVKANRPKGEPKERKKRDQAFVRPTERPTQVHVHAVERCPDCDRKLTGGWEHRRRQVIEIPAVTADIIDHVVLARRCGVCGKRHLPKLDLSSCVVGQHRVGVRLMSLIGWLREVGRIPVRRIQALLLGVYGLHLSAGEICEVLHTLAQVGKPLYEALLEQVASHPFVHADETGWREDGQNGYIWSFCTPRVRFFAYNKSRSHAVPEEILGSDYQGILCSDFYSGYNYHLGLHQRCWVHFARDLHALKEEHSQDPQVRRWVEAVLGVYHEAKEFHSNSARARIRARERFQRELARLSQPYARSDCPQRVLAQRAQRFLPELFTFVEHPDVPSDNNAAERAIRPQVIQRKVSGGTRSPKGSDTRSVLMSLFATWQAQGRDCLATCQAMLTGKLTPTPDPA
jgi:transposase